MLTIEELNSSSSTVFSNVYPSYKIHVAEESSLTALMIYIDSLTVHYFISKSIIQSNLDYPNPRLSELQSQAKVQVKVQTYGIISMCTCAVESSAAIVRYVCVNSS